MGLGKSLLVGDIVRVVGSVDEDEPEHHEDRGDHQADIPFVNVGLHVAASGGRMTGSGDPTRVRGAEG